MELQATSVAAAKSQSATPSPHRLVIRVEISSRGPPKAPVLQRRAWLILIVGALAVLLGWGGISVFSNEPAPPTATATAPSEQRSVVPEVQKPPPEGAPSPVSKVIPDVPRSARRTIRGTVRVSVRVIVDRKGTVIAAAADDPGPSRYFERLALQASKKWRFAPTDSEVQRSALVSFNFTREGTTARAASLQ